MSRRPFFFSKLSYKRSGIAVLLIGVLAFGVHRARRHSYVVVTPERYSECVGPIIVARIHWDMRGSASGPFVFLSAYRVGMLPTTFWSGPLVGDAVTGDWVTDGTTIILTDQKGRLLAKRTIESVDCPTKQLWPTSS
jgi:hypothetical protein